MPGPEAEPKAQILLIVAGFVCILIAGAPIIVSFLRQRRVRWLPSLALTVVGLFVGIWGAVSLGSWASDKLEEGFIWGDGSFVGFRKLRGSPPPAPPPEVRVLFPPTLRGAAGGGTTRQAASSPADEFSEISPPVKQGYDLDETASGSLWNATGTGTGGDFVPHGLNPDLREFRIAGGRRGFAAYDSMSDTSLVLVYKDFEGASERFALGKMEDNARGWLLRDPNFRTDSSLPNSGIDPMPLWRAFFRAVSAGDTRLPGEAFPLKGQVIVEREEGYFWRISLPGRSTHDRRGGLILSGTHTVELVPPYGARLLDSGKNNQDRLDALLRLGAKEPATFSDLVLGRRWLPKDRPRERLPL